jgi:hypothetical protein
VSVDLDARSIAETAALGVVEIKREIAGVKTDVAKFHETVEEIKRGNRNAQYMIGGLVTLATVAIGAITQVQVASIGAQKAEQSTHAATTLREDEVRAIENRVASKLDDLRTELERQRRGNPPPIQRAPDVVAAVR